MVDPRDVPEFRLWAGDDRALAIDLVLPPLEQPDVSVSASAVLAVTDGWLTFWVGGINAFETVPNSPQPQIARSHSPLSLSMLLEWFFFDRAYLVRSKPVSFSDVIAGESSPPIQFESEGEYVNVSWDFENYNRRGHRYVHSRGCTRVPHQMFLLALAATADALIAVADWRARAYGCERQWREWLAGYADERREFEYYVRSQIEDRG